MLRRWGVAGLDGEERFASSSRTGSWLVFSGHLFRDLASGGGERVSKAASTLLERLAVKGPAGLLEIDGSFAAAHFDATTRRIQLVRDRFGEEPLFYGLGRGGIVFGSRTFDLVATGLVSGGICPHGLAGYLAFGFVAGEHTLDAALRRVPAGGCVTLDLAGNVLSIERWHVPGRVTEDAGDSDPSLELGLAIDAAIRRRSAGGRAAVLVGPGETARALARRATRLLAPDATGFEATFGDDADLVRVADHAAAQDVPVADPGNDASILSASLAAAAEHELLVCGIGGEELFATDRVYEAEARSVRLESTRLGAALVFAARRVAARFARGGRPSGFGARLDGFVLPGEVPAELGAMRWRVLRTPHEILSLASVETVRELAPANPWKAVLELDEGRSERASALVRDLEIGLFVANELRHGSLVALRRIGIEARLPARDPALVDRALRIPARKKLERTAQGSRLLAETLPDETRADAPQRAHPRHPVSERLRGEGCLAAGVLRLLSPESVRARGLFRPDAVRRLLAEHRSKRRDHTGRIWSLVVLELWLRARERSRSDPGALYAAASDW
ncbi:Putative asparagine synthetase [glutamine-hydrolyzing] [Myxococcaceae bacterium]|jgi:asparagine synthase (glutamine-hydrolysing)|nr:Putative asparagine synthetase [glutamine-hydrolyzing] [Myxococcaceae bacterium]